MKVWELLHALHAMPPYAPTRLIVCGLGWDVTGVRSDGKVVYFTPDQADADPVKESEDGERRDDEAGPGTAGTAGVDAPGLPLGELPVGSGGPDPNIFRSAPEGFDAAYDNKKQRFIATTAED